MIVIKQLLKLSKLNSKHTEVLKEKNLEHSKTTDNIKDLIKINNIGLEPITFSL